MHIVQGLFIMLAGFLVIVFRPRIKDFTGSIGFAERYLGAGGTWTFLLLVGLLMFIGGLMWATGTIQGILWGSFGSLI